MYFWMLHNSSVKHKTANIDGNLPSALLAYILAARGILAPVDGQPAFESDCVAIHQQATVYISAASLIRTQEPCILSLQPSIIRRGITDDEYRTHYQTPLGMNAEASTRLMNIALAEFNKYISVPSREIRNHQECCSWRSAQLIGGCRTAISSGVKGNRAGTASAGPISAFVIVKNHLARYAPKCAVATPLRIQVITNKQ